MIRISTQQLRRSSTSVSNLAYDFFGSSNDRRTNPLIIGHGLFGHKRNWRSLAHALQKLLGNQIFTIDFRNHGDSPHYAEHTYPLMSSDLETFVQHVKEKTHFDSFFFLGHSMGGKVMSNFALNSPNASSVIYKLIIEDIAPHRSTPDTSIVKYIRAMKNVDLSRSRHEIEDSLQPMVPDNAIRHFLMMNLARDETSTNRFYWKVNLDAIDKNLEHIFNFKSVGSFSKPTLFLSGGNSVYITPADRKPLSEMFLNSSFTIIPNAGHWVHVEQSKLFVDCVVEFMLKN